VADGGQLGEGSYEPCGLRADHYEPCRSQKAIDARNAAKRAKRAKRRKLHEHQHPGIPWKGRQD
jgi:hypothetical protein